MARPAEPRRAVTASAVVVDLSRPVEIKRQAAARQPWQQGAWTYYDSLPEVRYPANFVGSALSRFILRVGIIDPKNPNSPPVPFEESGKKRKPRHVSIAEDILLSLGGAQGGTPEILSRYGVCMNVAADGWLLGQDENDATNWEFLSTDELQFHEVRGAMRAFRDREGTGIDPTADDPLPDGIFYRRFWRPHTRFSSRADGALEALQDDCERLLALNDSITSRLMSRLAQAGILFIPSGITLPVLPNGVADPANVTNPQELLIHRLLAYFEASILNRKSAAGAMPIPLVGPDNLGEKIRHITMDRAIDETELKLRAETRSTIAQGQDLPPEVQAGLKDATHFQTWGVMDSSFRNHLQPLAERGADGFTRVFLRPACRTAYEDEGLDPNLAEQVVVIADGSQVVSRPNEAEDGRQLHDRVVISDAALRARSGVPEADEPEEDEYLRILGRQINDPYLATFGMEIQKKIDWKKVGAAGAKEGAPGVGSIPPTKRPADSSDPAGAPGETKGSKAGGVKEGGEVVE